MDPGRRGILNVAIGGEANLRQAVLQKIRLDVISGEIEPGTVYSVPALARSLGISTTPIREALLQLTTDGLLQPMRNRGFRVIDPSEQDLLDIFDVRLQLETMAVVKLAGNAGGDVGELRRLADAVAKGFERGDSLAYLAADRAFHSELLVRGGNQVLTDIVLKLRDRMRLYGIRSRAGMDRQRLSVDEHYAIIRLIERSDITGLTNLMRRHIMDWQPIFVEALRARCRSATKK